MVWIYITTFVHFDFIFICIFYVSDRMLSAYQITYRRNSSNSNATTVDVLSPSARQYMATGLKPEMVYVFRLTAQTRKGWGEAAEALVVTTDKRSECIILWLECAMKEYFPLNIGLKWNWICVPLSWASTHQLSRCPSRRSPGSQSPVIMGTGQRRPFSCSLLHSTVQGAPRQQLDCSFSIGQPWGKLLHCRQVNI